LKAISTVVLPYLHYTAVMDTKESKNQLPNHMGTLKILYRSFQLELQFVESGCLVWFQLFIVITLKNEVICKSL